MSASPFDHPLLSGLTGDEETSAHFALEADVAAMLRFELALAAAEAAEGLIPAEAGRAIAAKLPGFAPQPRGLRNGVAKDGVVVPELVKQLRATVGGDHGQYVHFGATSQDVIDTGLALRLGRVLDIFATRLDALVKALAELEARDGDIEVMGHTRMQAAVPVTVARKTISWRAPLERHRARLQTVREGVAIVHLGGAAGTLDMLGGKGAAVADRMARRLGLGTVDHPRHSERDGQAELANWLSLVTGCLGKMGQDIALMAQSEVGEVRLAATGGSSAMPHKQNPVGAEVLVTLARFNATLVSGMHHALVHENERSGAAWTLEWMLLPQMAVATGAALRLAAALVDGIRFVRRGKAS
jgi:3-carboxy-cis,cis-muconate cycloisomerase